MANPEHLKILQQGVEVWNRWRLECPDIRPDLVRASLRGMTLRGADLSEVDLTEADLSEADLGRVDLSGANLSQANLSGVNLSAAHLILTNLSQADLYKASLSGAHLGGANLHGANLKGANLGRADLWDADLQQANLASARLYKTVLGNTNLTAARGLNSCRHRGSSIIDHQTLMKSGRLPLAFLRGCGLPESLIEYLPSLFNQPIQLYSVFISYSHQDETFAKRLHDALQGKGVRCWYAPEDIQGGRKIYEQIDEAIRIHDKLLIVLSEHSMQSEWVKTELANARRREIQEKRRLLFPIRLVDFKVIRNWTCFDADTGKDSAREIREYFIPDFSNWKDHDSFEKAFARLLRDLKADETQPST